MNHYFGHEIRWNIHGIASATHELIQKIVGFSLFFVDSAPPHTLSPFAPRPCKTHCPGGGLVIRRMTGMTGNRSVPVDTVLPHLMYRNLPQAMAWLSRVFGLMEHYRYGDPVSGAQMYLGHAFLMVKQASEHASPAESSHRSHSLTIFIEDVEGHFSRAKAGGAQILETPHETVYGEFQYRAEDLDGHHWLFSRHARDLSPADWGAMIVHSPQR
jgi:uncharacterized glyoxalase superfamily protein PhnB